MGTFAHAAGWALVAGWVRGGTPVSTTPRRSPMPADQTAQTVAARREEARVYDALGTNTSIRLRADQTGGAFEVIESVFPPGSGIPPHRHRRADEAVYVLEGTIDVQVGDRPVAGRPGTQILIPRG